MNIVFFEGVYLPENEAKISISDRGLLMGDGVFVTVQVCEGTPLFLKRHLQKLQEQIRKLSLAPLSFDEEIIETLIEKNGAYEGIWRLKIYYTAGDDTAMHLPQNRGGRLLMILKPYLATQGPLKVGLYGHPIAAPQSGLKSLSHIGRYMVMEEAVRRHLDDCVTVTERGNLLETAFGNLFWIKDRALFTPHPTMPLHFGVTISVICEIAKNLGMSVHYVRLPFAEISEGSCLFRSNAMGGIRPISHFETKSLMRDIALEEELAQEYHTMWQSERNEVKASLH